MSKIPLERIRLRTLENRPKDRFWVRRWVAKWIDLFIAGFLSVFLVYPLGVLAAFFYGLLADGLQAEWRGVAFSGQSLGKKLLGLRVVYRGRPATWRESILRNLSLSGPLFFLLIPLWGWVLVFLIGAPLVVLEMYWLVTSDRGQRLGDLFAETEVLDLTSLES